MFYAVLYMTFDGTWDESHCNGKHFAMRKKNDRFMINYLDNGNTINDTNLHESVLSLNEANVSDTLIINENSSVNMTSTDN